MKKPYVAFVEVMSRLCKLSRSLFTLISSQMVATSRVRYMDMMKQTSITEDSLHVTAAASSVTAVSRRGAQRWQSQYLCSWSSTDCRMHRPTGQWRRRGQYEAELHHGCSPELPRTSACTHTGNRHFCQPQQIGTCAETFHFAMKPKQICATVIFLWRNKDYSFYVSTNVTAQNYTGIKRHATQKSLGKNSASAEHWPVSVQAHRWHKRSVQYWVWVCQCRGDDRYQSDSHITFIGPMMNFIDLLIFRLYTVQPSHSTSGMTGISPRDHTQYHHNTTSGMTRTSASWSSITGNGGIVHHQLNQKMLHMMNVSGRSVTYAMINVVKTVQMTCITFPAVK